MSEIDQQFIEYVVKSLVGNPDAVKIERSVDEKGVLLQLTVDPEDLGRVIGKRGATAQSLRTLLRALGTKNDARYNLKIIDNGPIDASRPRPKTDDSAKQADEQPKSDTSSEETPIAEEVDEKAAEPEVAETPVKETEDEEEKTSDRLAQARAELADLDDLDV